MRHHAVDSAASRAETTLLTYQHGPVPLTGRLTVHALVGLLRRESDLEDEVHSVGGRFETKMDPWDFDGEVATQFGDYRGNDHRAFAAHFGLGYTLAVEPAARIGVAYNVATGDSDPSDGRHRTFDNLYPLNHAYYGYMDLFSWQNMHNAEATLQTKIWKEISLRVAYQAFWLHQEDEDAWYNAGAGPVRPAAGRDVDSFVGSEVDVTLKVPLRGKRVVALLGYSHFFTGDYVSDTGPSEDADFAFCQLKCSF